MLVFHFQGEMPSQYYKDKKTGKVQFTPPERDNLWTEGTLTNETIDRLDKGGFFIAELKYQDGRVKTIAINLENVKYISEEGADAAEPIETEVSD